MSSTRQVWHTIVALEPDDVEMVRSVGLAPAGLFVESCENCLIAEREAFSPPRDSGKFVYGDGWIIRRCDHHHEMILGESPKWHLVGSRVVEVGEDA